MKILSIFDGISCARVALERAGISVGSYFASEIDKYAIQISQKNYPDIFDIGGVQGISYVENELIRKTELAMFKTPIKFDLLIGGSPCQDLSLAKRDRKGLGGSKSGLFWEYVRILNEVKPEYFILENVASMDDSQKDIISGTLGVEPILIDAGHLSGQTRKRLFWVGKFNGKIYKTVEIPQPENTLKNIVLRDIIEDVGIDITERIKSKKKGTLSYKKAWGNIRTLDQKAKTLTASGQNISNSGATNIDMGDGTYRKLTPIECERLQGLPDNYTWGLSNTQRYTVLGNAFNVDVVCHIIKHITG